jgi:ketosteroid isomerase-like protein
VICASFELAFAASHEALRAMGNADPEPSLALWSRRDDAVLANPLGPPKVGFGAIEPEVRRVAATFAGVAGPIAFQEAARVVTPELAYVTGIERMQVCRAGADAPVAMALRVTTVFRREEDGWKLVLRHADRVVSS